MPSSPTPILHGGIVLSVSFGEWQNFLSDFYLLASPHTSHWLTHLSCMDRIAANDPFGQQSSPRQIDPPPRPTNA